MTLRFLSFVIIPLLLVSCNPLKVKKTTRNFNIIYALEAINLTEDKTILSSKNDELLISVFYINNSGIIDSSYYINTIVFDSLNTKHLLNIKLREDYLLTIVLTEIDTDNSEKETHELLENILIKEGTSFFKSPVKIDKMLKGNDFMGLQEISPTNMENKYHIRGSHLFDKFEYVLYLK